MKETTSLVRLSYQAIKKKRLRLSPKAILLVMVLCYSCHGVSGFGTTNYVEPVEDAEGEESTHLPLAPNTEEPVPKPANPPPKPTPRPAKKGPAAGIFRNCPTNGMECANKLCVHYHKWCDGVTDCEDGTDEQPAICEKYSCPFGFKKCKNNLQCVREERLCDGVQKDCQDNSDESAYLCPKEMLECKSKGGGLWSCGLDEKQCIPLHRVCDGVSICNDDELCENWKCLSGYRKCADQKRCVPDEWICNGWYDCEDFSDEINCDSSMACRPGFRMCRDKTECIRETDFCNERTDCSDDSDEEMCDRWTCFPGTLPCKDRKQCMPVEEFCNGKRGCNDGSDESPILCKPKEGCTCPLEWGNCTTEPVTCFPLTAECDGFNDCKGGSDEQDCDYGVNCLDNFWECENRKECVLRQERCDGVKNCGDGSDEKNCQHRHCLPGLRKCLDNNQCLPDAWFCNTKRDCDDTSDELFCDRKMSLGRMNSSATSNPADLAPIVSITVIGYLLV